MEEESSVGRATRAGGIAAAAGLFVLLAEVVWMVLPFVGFVSLHVTVDPFFRYRGRWFNPFFWPSYHPLGAPLILSGLTVFLAGALQVYTAKLRGTGAVTGGLYRFVRHPQYTALCTVGLGLLLLWPRYYLLLAFVTMCFLYFALARSEERAMLRTYGPTYHSYMAKTSFLFPGDRVFLRLRPAGPVRAVSMVKGFGFLLLTLVAAFTAALGLSAYTITHRHLPTVSTGRFVGLERLIHDRTTESAGNIIAEFFGRRRNDSALRRMERSRELLKRNLELLTNDPRVKKVMGEAETDCVFLALPASPRLVFFPEEKRLTRAEIPRFQRIYIAGIKKGSKPASPPEQYFDGYIKNKQTVLFISTLLSVENERVDQVIRVPFSPQFLDFWDRTLDKTTF